MNESGQQIVLVQQEERRIDPDAKWPAIGQA
jgi:hypothetical protein